MQRQDEATPTGNPLPDYLMANMGAVLNWMAGLIPAIYSAALAPLGVDGRHMAVLLTLQQAGPQVQARLSQITRIDKATMVGLLNDLGVQACIERRPHPADRRAYQVHLTPAGEALIARAGAATDAATERLLAALTQDEREQLRLLLVRVAHSVTPDDYLLGGPLR
jgi:DNA-binding MarR family transcriptional regulator